MRVAEKLATDGIEASVLDLRSLAPLDRDALLAVARRCHHVLIVHEDSRTGGIGESLAAIIQEEAFESLDAPVRIVGALDTPVPYSPPLEEFYLPSEAQIERAARLLIELLKRLESVDVVRGAIMIVMALDHTRDFFGVPGVSPTNVAQAGAALFFTRWITNICAPVFFLLTGTGAYLVAAQEIGRRAVALPGHARPVVDRCSKSSSCAVSRYQFNVDYRVTMLIVLWALGWSMIALGVLVHLPVAAVAAFGLVHDRGPQPVRRHQAGDGADRDSARSGIRDHRAACRVRVVSADSLDRRNRGGIRARPRSTTGTGARRRRFLMSRRAAATVAFVVLRAVNVYGDPSRWTHQAATVTTVLSFLNTTKYPPSLLFLLMTLGPALLMLRAVDGGTPGWLRPALVSARCRCSTTCCISR